MLQDWPLLHALQSAALRNQSQMQPQNLSNTVWAYSILQVAGSAALRPACILHLQEFDLQSLANLSWAAANSQYADHPLFSAVDTLLCSSQLLEMHSQVGSSHTYSEISRFSNHICQLIWAFSFSGNLTAALHERLRNTLLDTGLYLDQLQLELDAKENLKETGWEANSLPNSEHVRPCVVTRLRGISVIYKPPGWEVDAKGQSKQSNLQRGRPLSLFVQEQEASSRVVRLALFEYGFIHRLDVPSSGLLLVGTNFLGLATLLMQIHTYSISRSPSGVRNGHVTFLRLYCVKLMALLGREYIVLTADCWPAAIEKINQPVVISENQPVVISLNLKIDLRSTAVRSKTFCLVTALLMRAVGLQTHVLRQCFWLCWVKICERFPIISLCFSFVA